VSEGDAGCWGWLCRRWVLLLVFFALGAGATEHDPIRLGVLAFRDIASTERQWRATAEYLEQAVPGHHFVVIPKFQTELSEAVAAGDVDFVLTQPEHYVILRTRHGLAAVATLMATAEGHPVTHFGGVIFTRAERQDIRQLTDLAGKTIATTQNQSLGAYRMQQWTLLKAGVRLPDDAGKLIFTGQPQDKVVAEVMAGRADAGFLRTGVLEALAREGKLDLGTIKVINQRPAADFPQRLSTDLYPEWPLSARGGLPDPLVKAVTLALLGIPADSPAARQGQYYGFSPPADYSTLEAVMLRLGAHPDRMEHIEVRDIVEKFAVEIALGLGALLLVTLAAATHLVRTNRRAAHALAERATLLDSLGEGVYGVDTRGLCTFINPAALAILGYTAEEVIGQNQHQLFHYRRPNGGPYPTEECPISQTLADGRKRQGEEWFFAKDGRPVPVLISVTPIRQGEEGLGAVVAFRDISESKETEQAFRIAAIAFETQEAMVITDAHNRILRVNRAFTEVTGYSAEEAMGQSPALLKSGHHDERFYQDLWSKLSSQGFWHGEIWNRRKNGEIYPEWLTISSVRDDSGHISNYVASFMDITQRKEAEEQIQFLAFYDPLTRLPNRRLLHDRLEKAIHAGARHRRHGALLFIDLDNFKTLNDTMGHDVGDVLLKKVAGRLLDAIRSGDTLARLGGDEFVVILEDLSPNLHEAIPQIEAVAEKLLDQLSRPYELGDRVHHSSASVGVVPFLDATESVDNLLKSADLAMYKAKSAGKNAVRFFDPAMQTEVEARASLEHDLRHALDTGEFVLYLQPQVDQAGRLIGAEALIRWAHPVRGLIPPNDFIPLAEETGLILPIGRWVLERACQCLADWQQDPRTADLTLAINVSARQFLNPDFVGEIYQAIQQSGAPAHRLKLEVTESLLLEDVQGTTELMRALKEDLGVGLSLDDFGTGYSSLSYLKQLPLDQIKIDRSFVQDILTDANDAAIAETVIALGQAFQLTVVAEGVETEPQKEFLRNLGCGVFQGYHFGRPMPIADFPPPPPAS